MMNFYAKRTVLLKYLKIILLNYQYNYKLLRMFKPIARKFFTALLIMLEFPT